MRRVLVLVALPLAVVVSRPADLLAQEATPAASPVGAVCPAPPRSADELLSLWYDPTGSPVAVSLEPDASPAALPAGKPADPETTAAIEEATQAWAACYNAGDVLGMLALLSDDLARRQGPQADATREETRAALEAPPLPVEPLVVGEAQDARVLADGRVGAVFVFGDPQQPSAVVFIAFVEVDGRWLLDEIGDPGPAGVAPAEATPVA